LNLHFASVTTLTNAECKQRQTGNEEFVFDNKICTLQAGAGFCTSDEGGPVVANGQLIGAISWGIICAQGFPDVHSRISEHRDWILSHTGPQ
jgi:trypsin